MFREMRRADKQVDSVLVENILHKAKYGVLSTTGDNGYAYGVPLNYAYCDDKIYFHCAKDGHKLDNIKHNNAVCFTVVGDTHIIPQKFSTAFESVVVFGRAFIVEDESEIEYALKAVIDKFSPEHLTEGYEYIARSAKHTAIVRIDIERTTGKSSKE